MPRQSKKGTTTSKETALGADTSEDIKTSLKKLVIKNFRSIGETPIEIELDKIVILVGANNSGKSSILRAYQVAMEGSKLKKDDFPNRKDENLTLSQMPTIELEHIVVSDTKPGKQWIKQLDNGQLLVRERWHWESSSKPPIRQGYDFIQGDWSEDKRPWGWESVAKAYRPQPLLIDAFASPTAQEQEIVNTVSAIISDRVKSMQSDTATKEGQTYTNLISNIKEFQQTVCDLTSSELRKLENHISKDLGRVFPDYKINIDTHPDMEIEKTYSPFKAAPEIFVGSQSGDMSSISVQGSGTRRTLMWAALKYLNEYSTGERSRVLLLDEPEVCLHPSAIRAARDVLYDLSEKPSWQVMITTHSPIFIDLSRDNTTIIRVERNENGKVTSDTLYRPKNAKLTPDDRANLKLLNICDPYVHEFFFGGRVIIVEGDTEYTAFSYVKMQYPKEYGDIHIIRARGKARIPSLCKILNQFACSYAVLHDADTERNDDGTKNSAWDDNIKIQEEIQHSECRESITVIACKQDFEDALFDSKVSKDKPYYTLDQIEHDDKKLKVVKQLLDALLNPSVTFPPKKCVRWKNIEDLKTKNPRRKSPLSTLPGQETLFENKDGGINHA